MNNNIVRDRPNKKDATDRDTRKAVPVRLLPERVERFCQLLAEIYRTAGEVCH